MYVLQVGQPINPNKRWHRPIYQFQYDQAGYELTMILPDLKPVEVEAVRSGRTRFALSVWGKSSPIIFFHFRFDPAFGWSDCPFTWHMTNPAYRRLPSLDLAPTDGNALKIILAEGPEGIVKVLRLLALSHNFSMKLNQAIIDQAAAPFDQAEYDTELARIYANYTSADLIKSSIAKCEAGVVEAGERPEFTRPDQAEAPTKKPYSSPVFTTPRFSLGQMVATHGAVDALQEAGENPADYLSRHQLGDWGEVPPEDAKENEFSVENGYRILSAYTLSNGVKIWVITEADRSSTTILLPSEY